MDQRTRNLRIMELAMDFMDQQQHESLGQIVDHADKIYEQCYRWFKADMARIDVAQIVAVGTQLIDAVAGPSLMDETDAAPVTQLPVEPGKSWTRGPAEKGIKWGTGWVSPANTNMPKGYDERRSAGWYVKGHQADIMRLFVGEHGRVHISFNTIVKKVKIPNGPSQKPHTPIHSLIRRGLIYEVSKHVYAMTPRGKVWCEWMGYTPAVNPNSIETVAE